MTEDAAKFFERYDADEALRTRVSEAVAAYPGCLEIRESLVEDVLLPIAAEIGCPFTLQDLRAYETRKKLQRSLIRDNDEYFAAAEEAEGFWLLDNGWDYDSANFPMQGE